MLVILASEQKQLFWVYYYHYPGRAHYIAEVRSLQNSLVQNLQSLPIKNGSTQLVGLIQCPCFA